MSKTQVIGWNEFVGGGVRQPVCYVVELSSIGKDVSRKLKEKETVIKVAGVALILFAGLPDTSFAAGTGIDAGANKIYRKLINIGKWVIIVKAGVETIKNAADGDFDTVKKGFLGYGVTYAILWALPWMMAEIEKLFEEMGT